jgi:hypothetical protein
MGNSQKQFSMVSNFKTRSAFWDEAALFKKYLGSLEPKALSSMFRNQKLKFKDSGI